MRRSEVTGCCAAGNFYNVGGAHGHRTANSQEEFDGWILGKESSDINISLTNDEQEKTREYFKAAGWETHGPYDGIWISMISGTNLRIYRDKVQVRQQAERVEKEAQRRRQEEERRDQERKLKFSPSLLAAIYMEKVTLEDVFQLCGDLQPHNIVRGQNRRTNVRNAIQEKYKIILPNGWAEQNAVQLRQMIYDLVYKARKNAGVL